MNIVQPTAQTDIINHPAHYLADTPYEAIRVIEAWGLNYCLGNTAKYVCRAGRKHVGVYGTIEDLEKAAWYLNHEIERLKAKIEAEKE